MADEEKDQSTAETKPEEQPSDQKTKDDANTETKPAAAEPSEPKQQSTAEPSPAETKPADKPAPKGGATTAVPAKFKKLVQEIEQLSALELSELVKTLEDRFGVSAAAPVAVAAAPAGGGGAEGGEAEGGKQEFDIELKDAGSNKIEVIKAVREISGLGLAESKALVDGAPKTVKEKATKEEADEAKTKLEAAGAQVELK